MSKELILGKILSGLSKTLSIASQVIPIYQDTKPLFKKAKNVYNIFNNKEKNPKKDFKEPKILNKPKTIQSTNNPQFFI